MRENRQKTIRKLKTVRGQIDGIIKMIEDDRYCIDISNQLMAPIAILKNINRDVLKAHIAGCIDEAIESKDKNEIEKKLEEFSNIVDKLSK